MSEFVITTPSADSNCTQSITTSIDDEYITLSDTEYGSQYITIPLDKWQELKDRVDKSLPKKRRLTREEVNEQIKADPETFKAMTFYGLDFFYAQYHSVKVQYYDFKYRLALVDHKPYSQKEEVIFDTADELKAELFKLKSVDVDHSFNVDFDDIFDSFMFGVNDIKQCYGIGGDDE